MNLTTAPVRLITMVIAMPFRALSGYMLGQCLPTAAQIIWASLSLRKEIRAKVVAVPFWKDDWKPILKYTLLIAVWQSVGTLTNVLQSMVIRQRLPEVESAAYYMISRFAELGTYAGLSIAIVLFPIAAESAANQNESSRIFWKAYLSTATFGMLCTAFLAVFGKPMLSLLPTWSAFAVYSRELTILSLTLSLGAMINIFITFELAAARFGFLWYAIPCTFAQGAFFVAFTGYNFFQGLIPNSIIRWMASLKIDTLRNFLVAFLVFHLIGAFSNLCHFVLRSKKRQSAAPIYPSTHYQ